jgi:hypothetical protein
MDEYDSFYTVEYRAMFIHAKYNRTKQREEFTIKGYPNLVFYSLLASKQRVTRILRIAYGYSTMSEKNKRIHGFK